MDAPLADYNPYETLKDSMDAGVIRPELFAGAAVTQPRGMRYEIRRGVDRRSGVINCKWRNHRL